MFSIHPIPFFGSPCTGCMMMDVILSFKTLAVSLSGGIFRCLDQLSFGNQVKLFLKAHISALGSAFYSLALVGLLACRSWRRAWSSSRGRSITTWPWTVDRHARMFNKQVFKRISFEVRLRCVSSVEARWRSDIPTFFHAIWDSNCILLSLDLI